MTGRKIPFLDLCWASLVALIFLMVAGTGVTEFSRTLLGDINTRGGSSSGSTSGGGGDVFQDSNNTFRSSVPLTATNAVDGDLLQMRLSSSYILAIGPASGTTNKQAKFVQLQSRDGSGVLRTWTIGLLSNGTFQIAGPGTSKFGMTSGGVFQVNSLLFPGVDGTSNQVLSTDGAGNLGFQTVASGGGGGGAATNQLNITRQAWVPGVTNVIDFATCLGMVIITNPCLNSATFTSTNETAGTYTTVFLTGTTSNIAFNLPAGWIPIGGAEPTMLTSNKSYAFSLTGSGVGVSNVIFNGGQQP